MLPLVLLAAAATTSVTVVRPFDHGAPRAGLHVTETHRGTCVGGSDATDRFDAWRCGFGNVIVDPCFGDPSGAARYLLCLRAPWSTRAIRLQVTGHRGPNTRHHAPSGHPWGLQLRDGDRCGFVQGASATRRGLRLNYDCSSGGLLYGDARRGTPWTILRAAGEAGALRRVPIARAWY